MSSGMLPFPGNPSGVIFEAILKRPPPPVTRLNSRVPPRLEEVMNKALEKDRDVRCQSAAELRADLKRLKRDTESGKRAATASEAGAVTHSGRLLWGLVAGTAVVLLVGSAFLAWHLLRSHPSDA